MSKIVAVIPAFREERTIAEVVRGLLPLVSEVIVVDDASPDATSERARSAGAEVVRLEHNSGYDGALNRGFAYAVARGADILFTFDADGQHRVTDLDSILAPILENRADVVVGVRGRLTQPAEMVYALYTRLRFHVPDPLCGFKAYRREVYEKIGHFDTVRSIGTQLMIEAAKQGFRVVTVPIHIESRADESRFYSRRIRANWKILKAMWRVLFFS